MHGDFHLDNCLFSASRAPAAGYHRLGAGHDRRPAPRRRSGPRPLGPAPARPAGHALGAGRVPAGRRPRARRTGPRYWARSGRRSKTWAGTWSWPCGSWRRSSRAPTPSSSTDASPPTTPAGWRRRPPPARGGCPHGRLVDCTHTLGKGRHEGSQRPFGGSHKGIGQ